MKSTGQIILDACMILALVSFAVWLLVRIYRRSDDRNALLTKWISTALIGVFILRRVLPLAAQGGYGAIGAVVLAWICGLALAFIWRRSLAGLIAKPFGSLYDGGDQEIEPYPVYSVAQAKRKRGYYDQAVAEIRAQLARFPDDFEGQILLAEIQAENLNDVPGAEVTIHRLCSQSGQAPRNIAYALNNLADWHLKFHQDRDAAREDLEKIAELLPNSEFAALAAQRIGHLSDTVQLLEAKERKPITLKPGVDNLGLLAPAQRPKVPEADMAKQAQDYVRHLEEHPLDTEAREKLAVLYADHFQRLDLACDQLEQMISAPAQPARRVVHWLNLLADLQIRHNAGYETVRLTLQRIVERFPNTSPAQLATSRLALLKLEFKGKEKSQAVQLGSYEKDIGLKRGLPNKP